MKRFLILSFLTIFMTELYSQTIIFSDFDLGQNLPEWVNLGRIKTEKNLIIDRALNPFYLEADFNGDRQLDIALFVTETEFNKKGILIVHGESFDSYLIGAGRKLNNKTDDFSWLKVWKIYRKLTAQKTTFKPNHDIDGSEEIKLNNIAISVSASESTFNLIVWNGHDYEWIHTGD
ncbi:MAG: hypothetical protein KUL74_07285 [Cloacibacterium sp.]|nr:hypothetical protein [Cloacibacterium sp.]